MIDEGYIKYQCHWQDQPSLVAADIVELNHCRLRLYRLGLIGQYDNGIGFGNLSIRLPQPRHLIISGTQTGGIEQLELKHYTKVVDFDWYKNYVSCMGMIKASSETLTHGAIYIAQPKVNAVVHIHHQKLWQTLLNVAPTTSPDCAYGTPEMAEEIVRLCQEPLTQSKKIIVMSGHEEGILTFGENLTSATNIILEHFAAI